MPITSRRCSINSDTARFWLAALLVFGLLLYTGLEWIPPPARHNSVKAVHVPHVGKVVLYARPKVNLNTADVDRLVSLPGIGPVLAERIVVHREAHGPFASLEALKEVPGIGPAVVASIRDAVTVE